MKNECLTQKLAFDLSVLLPGRAVQLISSPQMPGESPRKKSAIVKEVSPFSITLIFVHLGDFKKNELVTGEVEEKTYPVEAFEGIGCYELKRLFSEDELKNTQE